MMTTGIKKEDFLDEILEVAKNSGAVLIDGETHIYQIANKTGISGKKWNKVSEYCNEINEEYNFYDNGWELLNYFRNDLMNKLSYLTMIGDYRYYFPRKYLTSEYKERNENVYR